MVKHPIFLLPFVSDSTGQSTILIPSLFLPLLRKRGVGLVSSLKSGIFCDQLKDVTNRILTFTGPHNNLWILCLVYVVYILNITANTSIGDISPHQHLYGQTPNISPAFCFRFYRAVYYSDTKSFSAPVEKKGSWVGFFPNIRDIL